MFIESILLAALGGFVGTCCRYLTVAAAKKLFGTSYPFGTFAANIIGCFIIGILVGISTHSETSRYVRPLLMVGFGGGFTTFSSFSYESLVMIQQRQWGKLLLYVVPSVALGLLMVWLGMKCV